MGKHRYDSAPRHLGSRQLRPFEIAAISPDLPEVTIRPLPAPSTSHPYAPGIPTPDFLRFMVNEQLDPLPDIPKRVKNLKHMYDLLEEFERWKADQFDRIRLGVQSFGWVFSDRVPELDRVDGTFFERDAPYQPSTAGQLNDGFTELVEDGIHVHAYNRDRITWVHYQGEVKDFLNVAYVLGSYAVSDECQ